MNFYGSSHFMKNKHCERGSFPFVVHFEQVNKSRLQGELEVISYIFVFVLYTQIIFSN